MYNLRYAVEEDWEEFWRMARAFYPTTWYASRFTMDEASVYERFLQMLAHGFVVIAEVEGQPVGTIGCLYSPFLLNDNINTCTELVLWVDEEHRKSNIGAELIAMAEVTAEEAGCAITALSELDTSPAGVSRLFTTAGYIKQDSTWLKEL